MASDFYQFTLLLDSKESHETKIAPSPMLFPHSQKLQTLTRYKSVGIETT